MKGAYFRLLEERAGDREVVEYRSGEKSEALIVEGIEYGNFSIFVFVLKAQYEVRSYVEPEYPVIITLNGQNHGEMTPNVLVKANLPEVSGSMIVEIRLDGLVEEGMQHHFQLAQTSETSPFTSALKERISKVLQEDEALREIEQNSGRESETIKR